MNKLLKHPVVRSSLGATAVIGVALAFHVGYTVGSPLVGFAIAWVATLCAFLVGHSLDEVK